MRISYFDTTICNDNLGNAIITESILKIFDSIFPEAFLIRLPYIEGIGEYAMRYIEKSTYTFFAGTNSLSSHMATYNQFGLTDENINRIKNIILCGLGWWQYQYEPDEYTQDILHKILHHKLMHSVRDEYTKQKLNNIGINNILNTGCPTMWGLTPQHCAKIPYNKSDSVLTTVTNYNQNPIEDSNMLTILKYLYKDVYLWVQGPEDAEYCRNIAPSIKILPPRISSLNTVLSSSNIDYVGTRLHAGIRALQFKKRAIIIGIDNRAMEISRDTGLPVIPRGDKHKMISRIMTPTETKINMPWESINHWKSQF